MAKAASEARTVMPPGRTAGIDFGHLEKMTLSDRRIERDVLRLFDRQAATLSERLCDAPAAEVLSCAHRLKGSARNIGAWQLAGAAERVEEALCAKESDYRAAVADLMRVIKGVRAAIAHRLGEI